MMLSKISFRLIITLLSFGFFGFASAQSVTLADKVSFVINNASVTDALDALSNQTGNTFSYNPDHIPVAKTVKIDMQNRPLIDVLNAILGSGKFDYRQLGNQIVLFRSKDNNTHLAEDSKEPSNNHIIKNPVPNKEIPEHKPDTVIIYRDIHDTVKITEVVTKMDTIIEKVSTPVSGKEIFRNTADLSKELTNVIKFEVGGFASAFLPDALYSADESLNEKIEQYNNSYPDKLLSGSAGMEFKVSYSRWMATVGLAYTLFNHKLNYSYLVEDGGYYIIDTLDAYYELIDGQPRWTYITDSTYQPVDKQLYDYKTINHTRYFEIPFLIGYNYPVSNMLVFAKAGIITGFFIDSDGHQIKVYENGVISNNEIMSEKVVFSYIASLGMAIPLGRKFVLSPSVFFRNHISSIYKNFPITTKFSAIGINAGLSYKL